MNDRKSGDHRQAFVNEISKIAGVENITECDGLPGEDESGGGGTWVSMDNNASRTDKTIQVDDNYFKLLGLELKEGRVFFQNNLQQTQLELF